MIIRLFILLILLSCSTRRNNIENQSNNVINVSTKQIYNYKENLFDFSINYSISNDHFVFTREDELFRANILTTIQLFDLTNDLIILQDSWENNIIEKFYNETRSADKMFRFKKDIKLDLGDYILKINVQDLDNNNVYSYKKEILLSMEKGLGEIILYEKSMINKQETLREIDEPLSEGENKIYLLFQYFQEDSTISEVEINIRNYDNTNDISLFDLTLNQDGFYSSEFEIPDNYYGTITINFTVNENTVTKSISMYNDKYNLWSDDIKEIVGVMRYILPLSDIKLLKEMKDKDQFEFIINFWSGNDPDTTTESNELLIEFKNRVKYVNLNFSDIERGWKSDKGRIYIIYGKPEKEEMYSSQSDGVYEIWTYPSGMKFTFLDRNRFGNFILIKQSL